MQGVAVYMRPSLECGGNCSFCYLTPIRNRYAHRAWYTSCTPGEAVQLVFELLDNLDSVSVNGKHGTHDDGKLSVTDLIIHGGEPLMYPAPWMKDFMLKLKEVFGGAVARVQTSLKGNSDTFEVYLELADYISVSYNPYVVSEDWFARARCIIEKQGTLPMVVVYDNRIADMLSTKEGIIEFACSITDALGSNRWFAKFEFMIHPLLVKLVDCFFRSSCDGDRKVSMAELIDTVEEQVLLYKKFCRTLDAIHALKETKSDIYSHFIKNIEGYFLSEAVALDDACQNSLFNAVGLGCSSCCMAYSIVIMPDFSLQHCTKFPVPAFLA